MVRSVQEDSGDAGVSDLQRIAVALTLAASLAATGWLWINDRSDNYVIPALSIAAPFVIASALPVLPRGRRAFRYTCLVGATIGVLAFYPLFFFGGFVFLHCTPQLLLVAFADNRSAERRMLGLLAVAVCAFVLLAWLLTFLAFATRN